MLTRIPKMCLYIRVINFAIDSPVSNSHFFIHTQKQIPSFKFVSYFFYSYTPIPKKQFILQISIILLVLLKFINIRFCVWWLEEASIFEAYRRLYFTLFILCSLFNIWLYYNLVEYLDLYFHMYYIYIRKRTVTSSLKLTYLMEN